MIKRVMSTDRGYCKHFVYTICSEGMQVGDIIYMDDYVHRKFEEQYKQSGGTLPLGSVIKVTDFNGRNNYGIVTYSDKNGQIPVDKLVKCFDSININNDEELHLNVFTYGIGKKHFGLMTLADAGQKSLLLDKGFKDSYGDAIKDRLRRIFAIINTKNNIVLEGLDLSHEEIKEINTKLKSLNNNPEEIITTFSDKFKSMSEEERKKYLKDNSLVSSSPEDTIQ